MDKRLRIRSGKGVPSELAFALRQPTGEKVDDFCIRLGILITTYTGTTKYPDRFKPTCLLAKAIKKHYPTIEWHINNLDCHIEGWHFPEPTS